MNDLATQTTQLPDTIEDLTQFVLVGKAKLQAYMMKLQTVNRLSVAQEIRDQTLKEAQAVSNALIAAEQRIGELLLAVPSASGRRTDLGTSDERSTEVKTKTETIKEMGYGQTEAKDYQQMAKHPEVVQKVMEQALANGDVVTKASVMQEIRAYKRKIAELEKQKTPEPEIREVEVVPDDYEESKREAKDLRAKAKLDRAAYNELMARFNKKCNEALKLQDEVNDLKNVTMQGLETGNLSENVFYFCMLADNFVGNAGGLVWLTQRINDMPQREKELFLKSAQALNDFSQVFLQNMKGIVGYEGQSQPVGRGEISALADQG